MEHAFQRLREASDENTRMYLKSLKLNCSYNTAKFGLYFSCRLVLAIWFQTFDVLTPTLAESSAVRRAVAEINGVSTYIIPP